MNNTTVNRFAKALKLLEKYWNYKSFRNLQWEIINNVLSKKDNIVNFPTGGGKSICFQIPALILSGVTLVITPLIALMEDQVQNLKGRGISAACMHSGMSSVDIENIFKKCANCEIKLLYISPERLDSPSFINKLSTIQLSLIAIDEAHCISQWGHDFRPAYLKIHKAFELYPSIPKIALTATATPKVVEDIIKYAGLDNPANFKKSVKRENIGLSVIQTTKKHKTFVDLLSSFDKSSTIVYCRSRREVQHLSELLKADNIRSEYYHAGLNHEKRQNVQEKFMKGDIDVICATNAFGMGLDKADVRQVVHFGLPPTIEDYSQEYGRAGRDGQISSAYMIYESSDISYLKRIADEKNLSKADCQELYVNLYEYLEISVGEGKNELFHFDIYDFCQITDTPMRKTFYGLDILKKHEFVDTSIQKKGELEIQILIPSQKLRSLKSPPEVIDLLCILAQSYEGIFDYEVDINLNFVSQLTGYNVTTLNTYFQWLFEQNYITYSYKEKGQKLTILKNRVERHDFDLDMKVQQRLFDNNLAQIESITQYLESGECRMRFIAEYFGETDIEPCGECDNCKGDNCKDDKGLLDNMKIQRMYEEGLL